MTVALSPRTTPLTFVFGNEGGDIDSVVSAIYTALILSASWETPSHIPIINFPQADLRLRGDIWTMLRDHGISDQDLLFEEHLHATAPDFSTGGRLHFLKEGGSDGTIVYPTDKIILTDHNVLRASQSMWADRVEGIIDHHADEKKYDESIVKNGGGIKRILPVGSATTLVALLWKERFGSPLDGPSFDAARLVPCPLLFLSPIVADTGNFKSNKNTPADEAARDFLISHIVADEQKRKEGGKGSNALLNELVAISAEFGKGLMSTDALAEHLKFHKNDIRGLSVPETLRRDYKRFALDGGLNVGISAILLTKKQCRKLYAEKKTDLNDSKVPKGAESDDEDIVTADANEDNDLSTSAEGFPTDAAIWLPSIAERMAQNNLNVYMNMFNKKGRELEVVYRSADAHLFEPVWNAFVDATQSTVGLEPKKRFPGGKPFEYKNIVTSEGTIALKQIVYRQHQTGVSRKNFSPFLVDHVKAFFAKDVKSDL